MRIALAVAAVLCGSPSPAAGPSERDAAVASNTALAADLYGALAKKGGNLFFSPFSISTTLAMTSAGARGETAEEMARVLHFGKDAEAVHRAFSALQKGLAAKPNAPFQLAIANRLFAQSGKELLRPFVTLTRDRYGAPVERLDFKTDFEPSRKHINEWVQQQTQDRIQDLLVQGTVTPETRLVLVNAVYFKGTWAMPFVKRDTRPMPFTSNGKTFDVPMMSQEIETGYAESDGVQVLELRYRRGPGARLAMLVLLPAKADGLAALESGLTAQSLGAWASRLDLRMVDVSLPKFKLESAFRLADTLRALGMKTAFEPATADFSGMDGQRGLYIGEVAHKAFVEVNEEGTEAAAATGEMLLGALPPPPYPLFRADHPFVFAIVEVETGSVLFLGRVVDPRG